MKQSDECIVIAINMFRNMHPLYPPKGDFFKKTTLNWCPCGRSLEVSLVWDSEASPEEGVTVWEGALEKRNIIMSLAIRSRSHMWMRIVFKTTFCHLSEIMDDIKT